MVSRVDAMVFVFVLFLKKAVGPAVWQSKTVWQLCQMCFACCSGATRAWRTTNLRSSGLLALGLAEGCQRHVCSVALSHEPPKLTAGVGVVGKITSTTRATTAVV